MAKVWKRTSTYIEFELAFWREREEKKQARSNFNGQENKKVADT